MEGCRQIVQYDEHQEIMKSVVFFFKGRDEAKIVGGKAECKVKIKLIVQFGA